MWTETSAASESQPTSLAWPENETNIFRPPFLSEAVTTRNGSGLVWI